MEDDKRKLLTLYLGECWHIKGVKVNEQTYACANCARYFNRKSAHRTFTTWQDLGDLKNKLVEKGDWERFCRWLVSTDLSWLLNPTRFCVLVGEWLEQQEVKG